MKLLLSFLILFTVLSVRCQDHNLEYYFAHAKTNSPLLADYRNQMQAASVDSQILKATQKIQVNGISTNYYAPVISGYGYDNVITNGAQVSAMVQANKNIITSANLATQFETIRLMKESIGNTAMLAEKDIRKTITNQYITVYGDLQALLFSREMLALFQSEDSLLKKLTQAGVYKQTDYLTFYVSLQQQQLVVASVRDSVPQRLRNFKLFIGHRGYQSGQPGSSRFTHGYDARHIQYALLPPVYTG